MHHTLTTPLCDVAIPVTFQRGHKIRGVDCLPVACPGKCWLERGGVSCSDAPFGTVVREGAGRTIRQSPVQPHGAAWNNLRQGCVFTLTQVCELTLGLEQPAAWL